MKRLITGLTAATLLVAAPLAAFAHDGDGRWGRPGYGHERGWNGGHARHGYWYAPAPVGYRYYPAPRVVVPPVYVPVPAPVVAVPAPYPFPRPASSVDIGFRFFF